MSAKSALVETGMTLAQIGQKIVYAVRDHGGTDDDATTVLTKAGLADDIANLILGRSKVVPIESPKVLQLKQAGIAIPAVTENFVVADHFQVNMGIHAERLWEKGQVKISYISENFQRHYLSQVVSIRDGYIVSCHKFDNKANYSAIRTELGVDIETDLAALYHLIGLQPEGGAGILDIGYVNIVYVMAQPGVVMAVSVRWRVDGWEITSYDRSVQFNPGHEVLTRNS